MAQNKKNKTNPLKSGNPAVAAAARAKAQEQAERRAARKAPMKSPTPAPKAYSPADGNKIVQMDTAAKPRKVKPFIRFTQIFVVVAILAGMILSSFSGLVAQQNAVPVNEPTQKVLVDGNGNPIDGSGAVSTPADGTATVPATLAPATPAPKP